MKTISDLLNAKKNNQKISMITAYDYPTAQLVENSNIDAILVGDSVAMVMHGLENTTYATVDMMVLHTAAVKRGAKNKLIVTDMPFLCVHRSKDYLFESLDKIVKAGAHAVKIEGGSEVYESISATIKAGIPVMGHLGLTPQSVNQIGGYKVQGKSQQQAEQIIQEAQKLQELGVFALILECVPYHLAQKVKEALTIPVIGIGAGKNLDGQILVIDDLLGRSNSRYPKFVRSYNNLYESSLTSLNNYHNDVVTGMFPNEQESYQ